MTVSKIFKTNKIRYSVLILLILVLFSFMIHYFNKARIHSEDVSQAEYYKSTHIAIVFLISLMIVLIFSWFLYVKDFDIYNTNNRGRLHACENGNFMDRKYVFTIYFISFVLFISSIVRYSTSVEVKSDKTEYYKRCMEGGALLLCSLFILFLPNIEFEYRFYTTCKNKDFSGTVNSEPFNHATAEFDNGTMINNGFRNIGHNMTPAELERIKQQNLNTINNS
jgi:hypothetical protein